MPALDPALLAVLRLALAILFASAAVHKLRDLAAFRAALAGYRLLPQRGVGAAAVALVGAECAAAGGLLWPGSAAGAAVFAVALLALYSAAILANLGRGRRSIDCGCSGPGGRVTISEGLVLRNAGLIAMAAACALPSTGRALCALDAWTVLGGVGASSLIYGAVGGLLANAPRLAALRVGA